MMRSAPIPLRWLHLALLLTAMSPDAFSQAGTIYEQAVKQIQNGKTAVAKELLDSRLRQDPQDLKALTLMGMAFSAEDRRDEGNRYFLQALHLNPAYPPAVRNLALNEMASGRPAAAATYFTKLIELTPSDPASRLGLAQACIELGQHDKAAGVLEQVPREAAGGVHFSAGVLLANI